MMKNLLTICLAFATLNVLAQADFDKNLATAKSSYASGNLEDARFAMQQMLTEIDLKIGKEVLKLLPAKMDALASNAKTDQVTPNTGLAGVLIHREYGVGEKRQYIDVMSNSPIVASLNTILSLPMIGNSGDGSQKTVKVQGYKGVLQRTDDPDTNTSSFTLQIPLNSTLVSFNVPASTETDVLRLANTIPLAQIAKLLQ